MVEEKRREEKRREEKREEKRREEKRREEKRREEKRRDLKTESLSKTLKKKKKPYYFGGLQVIKIDLAKTQKFDFMENSKKINIYAAYDSADTGTSGGVTVGDNFADSDSD